MPESALQVLPPAGANLSIQDILLSQMDTSDPTTSLVLQMLANQSNQASTDEDDEAQEELRERLKTLSVTFRKLRKKNEALQSEIQELRTKNDTLAAALGACYLCWGEYDECDICQGQGAVGYFPVEAPAFSQWILPALRAMKQQRQGQANS